MGYRFVLSLGVVLLLTPSLWGQIVPAAHRPGVSDVQVAFTYDTQLANQVPSPGVNQFLPQGGSARISGTYYRGLGVVADITGTHASPTNTNGVGLTLITATFGPSYTWTFPPRVGSKRSWSLFGEGLVGEANGIDSVFPASTGAMTEANSLALQIGGGADLRLSNWIGVRLLQADWLRTYLPNGTTGVQNSLQLGAGIVLHIR